MFDFFKSLFRPDPPSGATAKERLRLVLLSDHLSLAPDVVDALKRDLLEVISRYVEIDSEHADVTFEHREREVAMLASIPITGMREARKNGSAPASPPAAQPIASASAESAPQEPSDAGAFAPVTTGTGVPDTSGDPTPLPDLVQPLPAAPEPDTATQAPEPVSEASEAIDDAALEGAALPARSANAQPPRKRRRRKRSAGVVAAPLDQPTGAQAADSA